MYYDSNFKQIKFYLDGVEQDIPYLDYKYNVLNGNYLRGKDLLLGTRINLEKLYNRYIDLKIPKFESKNYQGSYYPSSNASCLNLGNNDEEQILVAIHENLHLHQTNLCGEFLFVPFVEGMTELTAEEYSELTGIFEKYSDEALKQLDKAAD